MPPSATGVYVHVPFRTPPSRAALGRLLRAVRRDLRQRVRPRIVHPVRTVLIGGPRPSLLPADGVRSLLTALREQPGLSDVEEVTMEVSPQDASPAYLQVLHAMGVTRVSFQAGAVETAVLRAQGRSFAAADVWRAVETAQATFGTVSVDLHFGGARPTVPQWTDALHAVSDAGLPHLTLIETTGGPPEPTAACFELAQQILADAGYRPYELTHWAQPGHASRHHMHVYAYGAVWGVGPGAESFWRGAGDDHPVFRTRTVRSLSRYAARLVRGASPCAHRTRLTRRDRACEFMMLRLRTATGLSLAALHTQYGLDLPRTQGPLLRRLEAAGHLQCTEGHLRLTASGRALADGILAALLPG